MNTTFFSAPSRRFSVRNKWKVTMEYKPRLEICMWEGDTWGRGRVDVFFLLNHWVRTIKDQFLLTNDNSIYLTLKDYVPFSPCTLEYCINNVIFTTIWGRHQWGWIPKPCTVPVGSCISLWVSVFLTINEENNICLIWLWSWNMATYYIVLSKLSIV